MNRKKEILFKKTVFYVQLQAILGQGSRYILNHSLSEIVNRLPRPVRASLPHFLPGEFQAATLIVHRLYLVNRRLARATTVLRRVDPK